MKAYSIKTQDVTGEFYCFFDLIKV